MKGALKEMEAVEVILVKEKHTHTHIFKHMSVYLTKHTYVKIKNKNREMLIYHTDINMLMNF